MTCQQSCPPPQRPVLRYHGGKWRLASWIISHFPKHRVYVEPFGGAASVLMRKPRSYAEIYNDLYGDIVSLFRVLRDPAAAAELERRLRLTPFAREELEWAYEPAGDALDGAHKMIVRSFMGFGATGVMGHITGFRANSHRSHTTPAMDWTNYHGQIGIFTKRLASVVIENRHALQLMPVHDSADTLFYVDPPYVHTTRSLRNPHCAKHQYAFEMDDAGHQALAIALHEVAGMVVLSGYPSPLYDDELYADWYRVERLHHADGARKRTEVLWINPSAAGALERATQQGSLIAS